MEVRPITNRVRRCSECRREFRNHAEHMLNRGRLVCRDAEACAGRQALQREFEAWLWLNHQIGRMIDHLGGVQ